MYPYRIFPLNSQNFPQTHKRTLENSKSSPIWRLKRRTENHSILETFLSFITEWRFCSVGALEGSENVSLCLFKQPETLTFFYFAEKVSVSGWLCWILPKISAKYTKTFCKKAEIREPNLRLSGGSRGLVLVSSTSRRPLRWAPARRTLGFLRGEVPREVLSSVISANP